MIKKNIEIGDIVWIKCNGSSEKHIQRGIRPGIVIQNNKGNIYSPTLQVIPLTSKLNKHKLPTHAYIPSNDITGLKVPSIAQCEGSRVISKKDVLGIIGKVDKNTLKNVAKCWLINNPLVMFFSENELLDVRNYLINQKVS